MKYTAGACTYCGRTTATVMAFERLTCPSSEAETCFTIWAAKANALFDTLVNDQGNDHGK